MTLDAAHIATSPAWIRWAGAVCRSLPRGRYRFLHSLKSQGRTPFWSTASPAVGGFQFVCHLRDSIAREVCFSGRYEPQETFLLQHLLAPGQTFVDAGANWGYFTLMAAARVGPTGRVLSFEPHPRLFSLLQLNLARNEFRWATAVDTALAAVHATMSLNGFDPADGGSWGTSYLAASPGHSNGREFRVTTAPLDDILDAADIDRVDLLKMDIEGAEALAIEGMQRGLSAGRYPQILLELHPEGVKVHGATAEKVLGRFLDYGYRAWRIDHSPAMTHEAAYAPCLSLDRFVQPLDPAQRLDIWPHLFLSKTPLPGAGHD